MKITQELLKEYLNYNLETGEWTWIKKLNRRIKIGKKAGSVHSDGYLYISIFKKQYLAHRLAFLYMKGYFPKEVDHIDRNSQNCSWNNLRECSRSQNRGNCKRFRNNTSGHTGVYWDKKGKKWKAQLRERHIGYFLDIKEAAAAYKNEASLEYGEFFEN